MSRFLVDTNVLVYAYDPRDAAKCAAAREVLKVLGEEGQGVLTAQILGEFYRVVTRRIAPPVTHVEAQRSVTTFARTWTVHDLTRWTILEAVRGVRQHGLSFWDSAIWASAKLNQVPNILTEDFSDGALVEGVRFVNPFSHEFVLSGLLP